MRIARNATIDHLRKQKKWSDVAGDEDEGRSFWDTLESDRPSAEDELHRTQQRNVLNTYIRRLAPEQREVLLLRQETDLTFREIAELTGVSINTALGRMRYALKNLRGMLDEVEVTPDALIGSMEGPTSA
jgi:RNA polymerase sigma-70 factor (ECF subfamily)